MTSVAIVGAGAIGSAIGWAFTEAGGTPTLCVRTGFDRIRITKNGTVSEVPAHTVTDPVEVTAHDWVVVTTKAQDTAGARPWLDRLVGPQTVVVVVQNGIRVDERVRPLVEAKVLPAMIFQASERTAPGEVSLHSDGRISLPAGPSAARFTKLLAGSQIPAVEDADFHTVAWRKLLGNAAANPITALTLRRLDVMAEPDIVRLTRDLITEAVAVGKADGANFRDDEVDAATQQYRAYVGSNGGGSSMLYDRLAGRPTEHEFITGAVVELGARHGVPTPTNQVILALMRALSSELPGGHDRR
ncbi:2-dehydropantoate 2-reductase [Fodinicola acaciae]|uniref:2-dehydropantoate 2-reductase n=1 Tax=Fodinicola acaciae TaxID=2681555 RepID=UPI0013D88411|nr:2-dehydropantoate 2-reductase [Fodinicola acaciae]